MNRQEIIKQLYPLISDSLNVDESEITENKKLTGKDNNSLGADSLDAVELIMSVESKFNIAIPDTQMEKLTDVKSIIDYIESNTQ